ncbi:heavy-metal-associated domain-containing protein [Halogranum rubrum]|uniref:Heavy metal transport/detoxification protein n=1 Tax=Halogranum salarium B-1 TaxID=1210908 RepID=J3JGG4_9EURY|nr:heavy metal-associated domain-containing protein [Halogranum salarium]EJN60104.1 Heavy metal transport/detoxification protein [Halogranum salarium B-1]
MTTTLTVEGMSCGNCEAAVEEALEGVDGVTDATADHEQSSATVEGDADPLDLVVAVDGAGYDAQA